MGSKIGINYIYNLIYQILNILIPLVTVPYISRVLGPDGIGTVSYAESIVSYFVLFANMGISIYGQREISYVQKSKYDRSIVFWETKIFTLVTAGISLLIYFAYLYNQKLGSIYYILCLNLFAIVADVSWFFQGMEEFRKTVTRSLFFRILNLLYVFNFVKTNEDILHYAFATVFFTLIGNISLWCDIRNYIEKPVLAELKPFRNVKAIVSLFVPTIAIQIYTVLDKTMIGIITKNSYENGYYELAIRMAKLVLLIVTSLGAVMVPRIGQLFQKQETKTIQELMYKSYRFVWFLGLPLTFGLIGVSDYFVSWFFGFGYEPVAPLLQILAFLILAIGISNVTGIQYLIPTKRQNLLSYSVVVGAITNFCTNLILIPQYGALGAAIASLGAEGIISCIQLSFVRKELSIRVILRSAKKYLVSASTMLLLLTIEKPYLSPNLIGIAIMVVSGASTYFGILYLLQEEFLKESVLKGLIILKKLLNTYFTLSERVSKYNKGINILFYITYSLYYFRMFLNTTTFELPWTVWLYRISLPLVVSIVVFRLLTIRKDDWKEVFIVVLLIGSSFINGFVYGDKNVFVLSMFVLAAKDTDFKRIVQISVGIGTAIMVSAYFCTRAGIIVDYVYQAHKKEGDLHSWGITYTTDCMAHVFYLLLGYLYLVEGKLGFRRGAVILLLDYYLYETTGARTNTICIFLSVLGTWVYQIWKKSSISIKYIELLTEWAMRISYGLAAAFMIVCTYFYSWDNRILERLSQLINHRLKYGKIGFERYGVHSFGSLIEMNGAGRGGSSVEDYFYLDSSYINILLRLGLIIFIVVLVIWFMINKKLQDNYKYALWLTALAALQSMIEHHMLDGAYNFLIFLYLGNVKSIHPQNLDNEVE